MAEIKCPTCGAGIDSDGKFCKYCGTKLPDNKQQIEISGAVDHNVNWTNRAKIAKIEKQAEQERWERENYDKLQKQNQRKERTALIIGFASVAFFFIFVIIIAKIAYK